MESLGSKVFRRGCSTPAKLWPLAKVWVKEETFVLGHSRQGWGLGPGAHTESKRDERILQRWPPQTGPRVAGGGARGNKLRKQEPRGHYSSPTRRVLHTGFPRARQVLPVASVPVRRGLVSVGSHGEKVHHFLNSPSPSRRKLSWELACL